MKKYLIATALSMLAFVAIAGAQTYSFSDNLMVGSAGTDVANLQSWLIANGYAIPAISSGATAKGYFGTQTKVAVMRFQTNSGIPPTGFVGPLTLAKLNGGGVINPVSSLAIISPNGGENWQAGSFQTIRWTSPAYFRATYADIQLAPYRAPCTGICQLYVIAPYTIVTGISMDQHAYNWNVGSIQAIGMTNSMPGSLINNAPPGQYTVKICESGTSNCDQSNAPFTIYSQTSGGLTPVINGIDAPTTLAVGQTGSWTVHATDPQFGTLSYLVEWGDVAAPPCPAGYVCEANPGVSAATVPQGSTFTHSYSSAGTYTVRFTVTNSLGLLVQSSATVQVGNSSTAGALRIVSPNGGEVWQKGTTQTIQWTSPYYIRATYADLKLVPYYQPCTGNVCPMNAQSASYPYRAPYTIATNISINQNSYNWAAGSIQAIGMTNSMPGTLINTAPDGQYTIQICETGTSNCESSDAPFTISSNISQNPNVTVVSPNGGEVWQSNSTHTVSWSPMGTSYLITNVDIYLGQNVAVPCVAFVPYCPPQFQTLYTLDKNIPIGTIYNWIVGTDTNNHAIPAGTYALRVCLAGSTISCDSSDAPFTISSSLLRVCPTSKVFNQMPNAYTAAQTPQSSYYILNGQRHELTEFDQSWVASYCTVPTQTIY